MRYDDLMILEGMFIDVSREDVKDVIRAELGEDISYCIETFDFENQKIRLKKDETDESYEIVPIKRSGATLGINIKRVKKEENSEKFSLSKNIVYAGKEKKGVTVSTLEEVETKEEKPKTTRKTTTKKTSTKTTKKTSTGTKKTTKSTTKTKQEKPKTTKTTKKTTTKKSTKKED